MKLTQYMHKHPRFVSQFLLFCWLTSVALLNVQSSSALHDLEHQANHHLNPTTDLLQHQSQFEHLEQTCHFHDDCVESCVHHISVNLFAFSASIATIQPLTESANFNYLVQYQAVAHAPLYRPPILS